MDYKICSPTELKDRNCDQMILYTFLNYFDTSFIQRLLDQAKLRFSLIFNLI